MAHGEQGGRGSSCATGRVARCVEPQSSGGSGTVSCVHSGVVTEGGGNTLSPRSIIPGVSLGPFRTSDYFRVYGHCLRELPAECFADWWMLRCEQPKARGANAMGGTFISTCCGSSEGP